MSSLLYFINSLFFKCVTSLLSTITFPLVAESIPPSMFRVVVFPAPLGPTITTSSPFSILKLALSSALIVISPILYSLHTFLNSMYGISISFLSFYPF